jgi:uncharacterized membrane protein YcaP (DUF421 family)
MSGAWWSVDWQSLFAFSMPPLELVVRGSAVYFFLYLVFRVVLRRDVGSIAIADVLILVLIADAAQNAMAGEYKTISDGFVLLGTLIGWNVLLDWLSFRFPALRRLVQSPPLLLISDGRLLAANLRKEMMSREELLAKLREHGVEDIAQVKRAIMEPDGQVSVIKTADH